MNLAKTLAKRFLHTLPGTLPIHVADVVNQLRLPRYREYRRFEDRAFRLLGRPSTVLSGPFAGMPYTPSAFHSRSLPKVLGTYEKEIHPFVAEVLEMRPSHVVDVGAAEGFYAVGFAWSSKSTRVVAFEAVPAARALLKQNTKAAHVDARVEVQGHCSITSLEASLESVSRPVILCDCEGGEDTLLDPSAVKSLRRAVILVETHDMKVPGVSERLRERFRHTHEIRSVLSRVRTFDDLPSNCELSAPDALAALYERPPGQEFLFMLPRTAAGGSI